LALRGFPAFVILAMEFTRFVPEEAMDRYQLLAAEIFAYSYANYDDHLGIGNIRYDKLMPDDARILERAEKEGWPAEKVAKKLDIPVEKVPDALRAFRRAHDVVDAENPAESFRWAVRQCIERAIAEGLRDEPSVERLVTQICYRAADLAYLLKREGNSLSRYSRHLRREEGVTYSEGYFDEEQ
jgi:hypothetical protein